MVRVEEPGGIKDVPGDDVSEEDVGDERVYRENLPPTQDTNDFPILKSENKLKRACAEI